MTKLANIFSASPRTTPALTDLAYVVDSGGTVDYGVQLGKIVPTIMVPGGDGVADDAPRVQAAQAALPTEGGRIQLGRGTFTWKTPVTINKRNVHIVGTGSRNVQEVANFYGPGDVPLFNPDVHTTIYVDPGVSLFRVWHSNPTRGFKARDFTALGNNNLGATRALYAFDMDKRASTFDRDYQFERLSIARFDKAFFVHNSLGSGDPAFGMVRIQNCNIVKNRFIIDVADSAQLNGFEFTGCDAGQNGAQPGEGGIRISAHNCAIWGNILEGQRNPIEIVGNYRAITIKENYFEGNSGDFLIKCNTARHVEIGPNYSAGLHTCDQTYVMQRVFQLVVVGVTIHPRLQYLSADTVIRNKTVSPSTEGLLAGSITPWSFVTEPHKNFENAPTAATNKLAAHPDSVVASCLDPFSDGHFVRGYSQTANTNKVFTFTDSQITFVSGDWVVVSFTMKRNQVGVPTKSLRFTMNINGVGGVNGSWSEQWADLYNTHIEPEGLYTFCLATKAQVNSSVGGTTLAVTINAYDGTGNDVDGFQMTPMSAYVVTKPGFIQPWTPWGPMHEATAAPTGGTWAVGDKVYNAAPAAAGTVGWVCTTAGTPGTWKTFGTVEA